MLPSLLRLLQRSAFRSCSCLCHRSALHHASQAKFLNLTQARQDYLIAARFIGSSQPRNWWHLQKNEPLAGAPEAGDDAAPQWKPPSYDVEFVMSGQPVPEEPSFLQKYWLRLVGLAALGGAVAFVGYMQHSKRRRNLLMELIHQGVDADRMDQPEEALRLYHEALKIIHERVVTNELTQHDWLQYTAWVFDAMGNVHLAHGDLWEAEGLFKETISRLSQPELESEYDQNAIIELSLKLCTIYAMTDRKQESETGYRWCVSTLAEAIAEKRRKEMAKKAGKGKGKQTGQAAKTDKHLPQKEVMGSSKLGENAGVDTKDVAMMARGHSADVVGYAVAADTTDEPNVEESITRWGEDPGIHLSVDEDTAVLYAMACDGLSRLLLQTGRALEAELYILRATECVRRVYGGGSRRAMVLSNNLGRSYAELGMFTDAETQLSQAAEIARALNDDSIGVIYANLGNLCAMEGYIEQAEKHYDSAAKYGHIFEDKELLKEVEDGRKRLAQTDKKK